METYCLVNEESFWEDCARPAPQKKVINTIAEKIERMAVSSVISGFLI
jgi:hypothetical protein